ncbi:MAG TPA: carboxypeptidase-like regulatory domain-containing protein [Gemmatimonadales bacterium]|jgi:hypothetical protein|nr:carboxypeptidase-like regulatory domain-containing protein [Gemmatimonadales bacterium]
MRIAAVAVAALVTVGPFAPPAVPAQTVRGQLVDSISRSPLYGAFLTLIDHQGVERARAITDQAGRYVLIAPTTGVYRVRSKRIGFRPYLSAPLTLRAGESLTFNAAIDPIPIALEQVVVAGERQCDIEAGASVAALWEEVREALAAVAWSARSPGYWYDITNFQRELTPGGRRQGEDSTWTETSYQPVPFRSVPAESLEIEGFVVVEEAGWTYHGPDADVLLSEPFLRTHCFETRIGRGETQGLVGLAFSPARGRKLPDVAGTLWVDRQTAELRHLDFHFTNLPQRVVEPRAGGHIEFMRLPTGAWIVREWRLLMPLAAIRRAPNIAEPMPEVVALRESGARADQIKTSTGTVVYRSAYAESRLVAAGAAPSARRRFGRTRRRARRGAGGREPGGCCSQTEESYRKLK